MPNLAVQHACNKRARALQQDLTRVVAQIAAAGQSAAAAGWRLRHHDVDAMVAIWERTVREIASYNPAWDPASWNGWQPVPCEAIQTALFRAGLGWHEALSLTRADSLAVVRMRRAEEALTRKRRRTAATKSKRGRPPKWFAPKLRALAHAWLRENGVPVPRAPLDRFLEAECETRGWSYGTTAIGDLARAAVQSYRRELGSENR